MKSASYARILALLLLGTGVRDWDAVSRVAGVCYLVYAQSGDAKFRLVFDISVH